MASCNVICYNVIMISPFVDAYTEIYNDVSHIELAEKPFR